MIDPPFRSELFQGLPEKNSVKYSMLIKTCLYLINQVFNWVINISVCEITVTASLFEVQIRMFLIMV